MSTEHLARRSPTPARPWPLTSGRRRTCPAPPSPTRSSSPTTSRRQFGGMTAVDVDHLEVQRGAITALIGPNGAGKTTFFNLLTGFDKPDSRATGRFDGRSLGGRRRPPGSPAPGMVRTFQLTKALSRMTVIENMRLGATGPARREPRSRRCSRRCGAPASGRSPSRPRSCSTRFKLLRQDATTSPAASPAASASCSRWPGR